MLTGTVIGHNAARHRHQEFLRFLNQIEREVPGEGVGQAGNALEGEGAVRAVGDANAVAGDVVGIDARIAGADAEIGVEAAFGHEVVIDVQHAAKGRDIAARGRRIGELVHAAAAVAGLKLKAEVAELVTQRAEDGITRIVFRLAGGADVAVAQLGDAGAGADIPARGDLGGSSPGEQGERRGGRKEKVAMLHDWFLWKLLPAGGQHAKWLFRKVI